jgi:hypothetical protein
MAQGTATHMRAGNLDETGFPTDVVVCDIATNWGRKVDHVT